VKQNFYKNQSKVTRQEAMQATQAKQAGKRGTAEAHL
jgi:hypothetical protein